MKEYYIVGTPICVVAIRGVGAGGIAAAVQTATFFFSHKYELRRHLPKGETTLYVGLDQAIAVARNTALIDRGSIDMPPVFKVAIDDFAPLVFNTMKVNVSEKISGEYFISADTVYVEYAQSHVNVLKVLSGWLLFPNHKSMRSNIKEISLINTRSPDLASPKTITSSDKESDSFMIVPATKI